MHKRILTTLIVVTLANLTATIAAPLCSDAQCNINLTFPYGGTIQTDQGASITFGVGGEISLGNNGSLNPGNNGQLIDVTNDQLLSGGTMPEQSQIILEADGNIDFGTGGYLNLGIGGNIERHTDSNINIEGAEIVAIESEAGGSVSLGDISTLGSIALMAETIYVGNSPTQDGAVYINSYNTTSTLNVNATTIQVYNMSTAGQISIGQGTLGSSNEDCNNSDNTSSESNGVVVSDNSNGTIDTPPTCSDTIVVVDGVLYESDLIIAENGSSGSIENTGTLEVDESVELIIIETDTNNESESSKETNGDENSGGGSIAAYFLLSAFFCAIGSLRRRNWFRFVVKNPLH